MSGPVTWWCWHEVRTLRNGPVPTAERSGSDRGAVRLPSRSGPVPTGERPRSGRGNSRGSRGRAKRAYARPAEPPTITHRPRSGRIVSPSNDVRSSRHRARRVVLGNTICRWASISVHARVLAPSSNSVRLQLLPSQNAVRPLRGRRVGYRRFRGSRVGSLHSPARDPRLFHRPLRGRGIDRSACAESTDRRARNRPLGVRGIDRSAVAESTDRRARNRPLGVRGIDRSACAESTAPRSRTAIQALIWVSSIHPLPARA